MGSFLFFPVVAQFIGQNARDGMLPDKSGNYNEEKNRNGPMIRCQDS